MISCAACGGTRRDVTVWRQILALDPEAVCCWPDRPASESQPATKG